MTSGAHVEIVDARATDDGPLVPTRVLINGVDVGYIARDGVKVEPGGSDNTTQVTLTLLPSRVTIRGAEPEFKRWSPAEEAKGQ